MKRAPNGRPIGLGAMKVSVSERTCWANSGGFSRSVKNPQPLWGHLFLSFDLKSAKKSARYAEIIVEHVGKMPGIVHTWCICWAQPRVS